MIAPLAVGEAAIDIYGGAPAAESGSMCLVLEIRELRAPLRFCNRYVGTGAAGSGGLAPPELATAAVTDATTALGILDAQQFAQLHVSRVIASLQARRGLREATIIGAHAPLRVRAGRSVRVQLLVRQYRGALKRIFVRLRVPRRAHGQLLVTLRAASPPASSVQGLPAALALAIIGGPPPSNPPATSIASLRAQFAGLSNYDGVTATVGRRRLERVYRDPSLLITGSAELPLFVR
jgi:hypothetical protein